jgi:hypothetical protein
MKITITDVRICRPKSSRILKAHDLNAISVRYIPNQRFYIETDAIIHLAGKAHDLKGFESIRITNPILN